VAFLLALRVSCSAGYAHVESSADVTGATRFMTLARSVPVEGLGVGWKEVLSTFAPCSAVFAGDESFRIGTLSATLERGHSAFPCVEGVLCQPCQSVPLTVSSPQVVLLQREAVGKVPLRVGSTLRVSESEVSVRGHFVHCTLPEGSVVEIAGVVVGPSGPIEVGGFGGIEFKRLVPGPPIGVKCGGRALMLKWLHWYAGNDSANGFARFWAGRSAKVACFRDLAAIEKGDLRLGEARMRYLEQEWDVASQGELGFGTEIVTESRVASAGLYGTYARAGDSDVCIGSVVIRAGEACVFGSDFEGFDIQIRKGGCCEMLKKDG